MTIAELKRLLTLGTKVVLVQAPWLTEGQEIERTVTRVSSGSIGMTPATLTNPNESNLDWRGLAVMPAVFAQVGNKPKHGFALHWKNDPDAPRLLYRWSDAS